MPKIAIISERDNIWALPVWQKAIPLLQQNGMEIVGIWICPAKLGRLSGIHIPKWYFTYFGALDFIKLGLFSLFSRLRRRFRLCMGNDISSFASLAKHYGIQHHECKNPNDPKLITILKSTQVEILITWVGYTLKQQILEVPRRGCINKHASILPSYKGLFPYLWAYIANAPQGISFHVMTETVDEGEILIQENVPSPIVESSMVGFYLYVYQNFSQMLLEAIKNLISGSSSIPQGNSTSSFGLPNHEDVNRFRKAGGKIIRWQDILKAL
jgi:folate-dependent phosphoribosylglycinamide formyltransferase PurN